MAAHSSFSKFIGTIIAVVWVISNLPEARAESDPVLSSVILTGYATPLMNTSIKTPEQITPTINFRDEKLAGLKNLRATRELRIRGWEVRENLYFGHTKVGDRWGLGILIEHDSFIYGINNRGIQILKRF